jgi:hypothetical protein
MVRFVFAGERGRPSCGQSIDLSRRYRLYPTASLASAKIVASGIDQFFRNHDAIFHGRFTRH